MRRLTAVGMIGVAAVMLALLRLSGAAPVPPVAAATPTATSTPRASLSLPARFQGSLLMFGKKPSGNVAVTAYVGATSCGAGTVKSGVYFVNVQATEDAAGCGASGATVSFKVGDYWANETGQWVLGQPQTLNLTGPKMSSLPLTTGCGNQVTLTFAAKTPVKTLRTAVAPDTAIAAIWRWNSKTNVWEGDFPGAPDSANTLKTVDRLDVVWVCVTADSTFSQPSVDGQ